MVSHNQRFGTSYRSHLQGSRIQKDNWQYRYVVYIAKSTGGGKSEQREPANRADGVRWAGGREGSVTGVACGRAGQGTSA